MNWLKRLFLYVCVGHTYSNLSRLFLRLFTGVMFLQLGIRQVIHFDEIAPGVAATSGGTLLTLIVVAELLCATLIMIGLLMRLALLPSIAIMLYAQSIVTPVSAAGQLFNFEPGYPVMFIGIFIFLLLAGPGKISLDYIIAAYFTETPDDEQAIENA